MPKIIVILLFLSHAVLVSAQHLTPVVVGSAGSDGANGDYHLSWTLGEVAIVTQSRVDATLLQGFQQPNYYFDVLVWEPEKGYDITLFPNPTSDWITIRISGPLAPLRAELFDLFGRPLFLKNVEPPQSSIDLGSLPGGTYLLRILDDKNERVGAWRVQKMW